MQEILSSDTLQCRTPGLSLVYSHFTHPLWQSGTPDSLPHRRDHSAFTSGFYLTPVPPVPLVTSVSRTCWLAGYEQEYRAI